MASDGEGEGRAMRSNGWTTRSEERSEREIEAGEGDGAAAAPTRNVLVAFTGSVASIKAVEMVTKLRAKGFAVKACYTSSAARFFDAADLPLDPADVHGDDDEWRRWSGKGDPVLHVELRRWADVFLVAPLSANTLAKMANGLSDNLVACVFRCWDFTDERKRVIVAPAMNTWMYESPFTTKHLNTLAALCNMRPPEGRYRNPAIEILEPIEKTLACGEVGDGAMQEVDDVVDAVDRALLRMHLRGEGMDTPFGLGGVDKMVNGTPPPEYAYPMNKGR